MESLLTISELSVGSKNLTIVKDFNLEIHKGEMIGIVGESGCGKSTMLKSIVGLSDYGIEIKSGRIDFKGIPLHSLKDNELRSIRGKEISVIFQKPESMFDPVMKIKNLLFETVKFHVNGKLNKEESFNRSKEILEQLHFENPEEVLNAYPFELSGGMNQRVAVAMAMINNPELILADEPTSALDVSVQSQVVRTFMELQEKTGVAILMVTHNINVVAIMADHVGVMYGGRMVEFGSTKDVLERSRHPYTNALLNAVPTMTQKLPIGIAGMPPKFSEVFKGCPFRERCINADETCREDPTVCGDKSHWWLCHKR